MTPGTALRAWLNATGMKQAELARRCGVSPAAMSRFVGGSRPIGKPFAIAIEQVMTDAYRRGEVSVQPLRSIDLEESPAPDDTERPSLTGT